MIKQGAKKLKAQENMEAQNQATNAQPIQGQRQFSFQAPSNISNMANERQTSTPHLGINLSNQVPITNPSQNMEDKNTPTPKQNQDQPKVDENIKDTEMGSPKEGRKSE